MELRLKGKDVLRIRSKYGWTQKQFGECIGLSASQISRYEINEAGYVPPKLRPLLHEIDKNGYVSTSECNVDTTVVRDEIVKILQKTKSKNALLRMLAFAKTIHGE